MYTMLYTLFPSLIVVSLSNQLTNEMNERGRTQLAMNRPNENRMQRDEQKNAIAAHTHIKLYDEMEWYKIAIFSKIVVKWKTKISHSFRGLMRAASRKIEKKIENDLDFRMVGHTT